MIGNIEDDNACSNCGGYHEQFEACNRTGENEDVMTNEPTKLQKAVKDAEEWKRNWTGASKGLFKPSSESIEQLLDAAKRVEALQAELKQEKIWKEEDPRMLREQVRVHDVAFQHLHDQHKALQKENEGLKESLTAWQNRTITTSMFMELQQSHDSLKSALESTRRTLCFFASVIKSGESWTATCEKEFTAALPSISTPPTNADNSKDVR